MFILTYLCLPKVNLEEGQSGPIPHIPSTLENLGIFVNLRTNSIIKCNFTLAHETICILYLMVGSTHHTSNPVIYIPLVNHT